MNPEDRGPQTRVHAAFTGANFPQERELPNGAVRKSAPSGSQRLKVSSLPRIEYLPNTMIDAGKMQLGLSIRSACLRHPYLFA